MKKYIIIIVILLILIPIILIFKPKDEVLTNPYVFDNATILENDYKKGMTIKDKYDNEWVWIVVPKNIFKNSKNSEDYENILKDIKEYTKEYSNDKFTDEIDDYKDLLNKTLKSIYEYGGFWVSRYEIGTDEIRSESSNLTTPYSKENLYIYNYVTFDEAYDLASKISNEEYESNLMFGFQWDLICKFIEEYGYTLDNTKITSNIINGNNITWGNYYGSTFKIDKGKYSIDNGITYIDTNDSIKKEYQNYILTTGSSVHNKVLNLYDFAGNASEWTLEKVIKNEEDWNTIRDGNFYFNYGGNDPVSGRYTIAKTSRNASYGFRIMIIK